VSLFSRRRPAQLVPHEILGQLPTFGRVAFAAKVRGDVVRDPRYDWPKFFSRVLTPCRTDLTQTIAEIHDAADGDLYAMYGGYRLIAEFEPASEEPLYLDLMDAGLQLMYDQRLPSTYMTGHEAHRWIKTHGDLRTSFDRIIEVVPPEGHAASLHLAVGESLIIARMGPDPLDNQFHIERSGPDAFSAFSLRKADSDAVTLTRSEEPSVARSGTVEGVLRSLGQYLRIRPYWAHEQLDPFFTERRDI
jgi:hypothetical protein